MIDGGDDKWEWLWFADFGARSSWDSHSIYLPSTLPSSFNFFFTTPADRTVAPYYYSHYSAIGSSSSTYPRRFNHRTNHIPHLSFCFFLSDFQLGPCARRHSAGVVLHGSIHLHQSVTKTVFTNVLHRTHNNGRHSWAQETVIQIRLALQRKKRTQIADQ